MTSVVNIRRDEFDVYVGRAGKGQEGTFGNPFHVQEHGQNALALFEDYFKKRVESDADFRAKVLALKGKRLGCFCRPIKGFCGKLRCHAQVIAGWLEGIPPSEIA